MILINKNQVQEHNLSHRFLFEHAAWECLNFHEISVFPLDIVIIVSDVTGTRENFIRRPDTGERLDLKLDYFYMIPCGLTMEYTVTDDIRFLCFRFNLEVLPGIDLFAGEKRWFYGPVPELCRRMRRYFDTGDDHCAFFQLESGLLELCTSLWDEEFSERMKQHGRYEQLFARLAGHCDAQSSVAELAQRSGMTPEAFSRRVHRDLGCSPKQILQQALLRRVLERLRTAEPLKQISDELRFSSEFYLRRFIKRQLGITPGEYQRRCLIQRSAAESRSQIPV